MRINGVYKCQRLIFTVKSDPNFIVSSCRLRTTAVGEVIKTLGTVSPSKLKEKVEPEWLRQTPLRTTSKGSKLRRQLSLRSDRNLARRITNESIDQNSEFIRKVRLRPTTRGKMLKRGHSIRGTERRSTPSGSSLSRSGSNNSTLESNSGQSETRERREATQKDGIMRLKKQRSVNAKHGSGLSRSDDNGSFSRVKEARASTKTKGERLQNDSRVRVTRQGSFDVTQGDRTMTLNIVHVNEEQPKSTRPVVLRATSKGARLMRGESLGKGQHKLVSPSSAAQTTDPICVPNDHLPDLIG